MEGEQRPEEKPLFFPPATGLTAKLYLLAIQSLGLAALAWAAQRAVAEADLRWLYLLALTAVAGYLSVKISRSGTPSGSVTISLGDFFVFAALLLIGPAASICMAAVEGISSSLRVRVRKLYKILFNVGQLSLSAYLVGLLFTGSQAELNQSTLVALLGVVLTCAVVYFLLNSLLVAIAMVLVSSQSPIEIGRKGFLWALPTHLVNASGVVIVLSVLGPMNLALAIYLLPLLIVAYLLTGLRKSDEGSAIFTADFFPQTFSRKAKGYLFVLVLAALPIYLYCLHHSFTLERWDWLYLAGLTVLAGFFPVRLFSIRDKLWLTASDVFVFAAMFHFGAEVAVVVASIEAVTFNLRTRPQRSYRWIFNVAQILLVAFLVGQFFHLLQGALNSPGDLRVQTLVLLLIAPWLCGFLYYALTSGLAAWAVALSTRQSFRRLWVKNLNWCFVSLIGAVLAAVAYVIAKGFFPVS